VEGVETRWLEGVEPDVRDAYKRAKGGFRIVDSTDIGRLAVVLPAIIRTH
jgi:hypothetical protein